MLAALALLLAAPQLGPVLAPGAGPEFHTVVRTVQESLSASNFEAAAQSAALLPKGEIRIAWDPSGAPAVEREELVQIRDRAFAVWTQFYEAIQPKVTPGPADLRIEFVEVLPPSPGAALPAGSRLTWSENPAEPRLRVQVALRRGNPLEPSEPAAIQNEITHAVGAYLGLATSPIVGNAMGRSDLNGGRVDRPTPAELRLAQANLEVAAELRTAVAEKRLLTPAIPRAKYESRTFELGSGPQGKVFAFEIKVRNEGNAPLALRLTPNCGCLTVVRTAEVAPGESAVLAGQMDTREFFGELRKLVLVMSNDDREPVLTIPVNADVTPRYRFLGMETDVILIGSPPPIAEVILASEQPLQVTGVTVEGLEGKARVEPFRGDLADPEMNEAARPRTGSRLRVTFDGEIPFGRWPVTLVVTTDDPAFAELRHNLTLQRGIVALPGSVFLGEIGKAPRTGRFLVSRPGKDFKVLRVESSDPNLSAVTKAVRGEWEHQVTVTYNGKADPGRLNAQITVVTDDPEVPKVVVPFTAVVR